MDEKELLEKTKSLVAKYVSPKTDIILFGSWAKKTAHPNSDLDIGLMSDKNIELAVINHIKSELDCLPTLRKIDIIDLMATDEKFRNNVLSYGKKI